MANFDLENYETVELRLRRLFTAYPNARVFTDLVYQDERRFIVKAFIFKNFEDQVPSATGLAEEIVGVGMVNKTSALENCETSAIGRAISNSVLCLDAPVGARPSQEEMKKVERYKAEPRRSPVKPPTEAQIQKVRDLLTEVPVLNSKSEATNFWNLNKEYLDIVVDKTTLKDALLAQVEKIK
jgi:hypothetical protein